MNWLWTFLSAAFAAMLGGAGALGLASLCVRWYQISSFEGKSGFFIAALTLAGAACGLFVGAIAARIAVANGHAGPLAQVLAGAGAIAAILALAAAWAYLGSDTAPTLGGKRLELDIQVRLPESQVERPAWGQSQTSVQLASLGRSGGVARAPRAGTVDLGSLHREAGRWVIAARVPLLTSRPRRVLSLSLGPLRQSFWLSTPPRPGPDQLRWTDWLPPTGTPAGGPLTYRARIRTVGSERPRPV